MKCGFVAVLCVTVTFSASGMFSGLGFGKSKDDSVLTVQKIANLEQEVRRLEALMQIKDERLIDNHIALSAHEDDLVDLREQYEQNEAASEFFVAENDRILRQLQEKTNECNVLAEQNELLKQKQTCVCRRLDSIFVNYEKTIKVHREEGLAYQEQIRAMRKRLAHAEADLKKERMEIGAVYMRAAMAERLLNTYVQRFGIPSIAFASCAEEKKY